MKLTRREKHALIIGAIILLAMVIINPSQATVIEYEWFYLLFVVGPLGFYIATDPEKQKSPEGQDNKK